MDPQATLKAIRARNQAAVSRMSQHEQNQEAAHAAVRRMSLDEQHQEAVHAMEQSVNEDDNVMHDPQGHEINLNDVSNAQAAFESRLPREEQRQRMSRKPQSEDDGLDDVPSPEEQGDGMPYEEEEFPVDEQQDDEEASLHSKARGDLARGKIGLTKRYG